MQWIKHYWVAIIVTVASIGIGVGLAFVSTSGRVRGLFDELKSKLPGRSNSDVEQVDNETTQLPAAEASAADSDSGVPAPNSDSGSPSPISIPNNLVPWGTGPSDQASPSTGGTTPPPANQVPWGTGPSQ